MTCPSFYGFKDQEMAIELKIKGISMAWVHNGTNLAGGVCVLIQLALQSVMPLKLIDNIHIYFRASSHHIII